MGKKRCFLKFFTLFVGVFVAGNAMAAYDCPNVRKYTSCNSGYYMQGGVTTGNDCLACTGVSATDLSAACDRNPTSTELSNVHAASGTISDARKACTGNHTGGAGGTDGSSACTGCSSYGNCTGGKLTISTCAANYYHDADNNKCLACSDLGYTSSESGNTGGAGVCYKACSKSCTQSCTISGAASCTYGTKTSSGTEYYGKDCDAEAPGNCPINSWSCKGGYYHTTSGCSACTSVSANGDILETTEITNGKRVETCTGNHTGGAGGTDGSSACTGCSASVISCECDTGYHSEGEGAACTCVRDCSTSKACSDDFTGYSGTYNECTQDQETKCYKSCSVACSGNATCPSNATCTYDTTKTYSGTQYYGGSCDATAGTCPVKSVTCNAGYYKNSSGTCSKCGGNEYYCPGDNKRYGVSSGNYSTGGDSTTRTGQKPCGENQYYCVSGVRYNVSPGYYSTGGGSTTRTGQAPCTSGTYCVSGVAYSCSSLSGGAKPTGGKYSSDAQSTASTDCKYKAPNPSVPTNCSSIDSNTITYTGSAWPTVTYSVTAKAGARISQNNVASPTCSLCAVGTYQPNNSSTATSCSVCSGNTYAQKTGAASCSSCPSGYTITGTAASNHDNKNDCKITCSAGTVVATADKTCSTPSGSWYSSQHTVSAGSTSGSHKASCVSGYATPNTTTKTDHDSYTDCRITCSAGTQVAAANAKCTTPNTNNWYTNSHTVAQGSTSGSNVKACDTADGYVNSGSTTANHAGSASCKVTCANGTYVKTANAACEAVGSGYYRESHVVAYGSTSTRNQCNTGYGNSPAGAYRPQDCYMNVSGGYFVEDAGDATATKCDAGYARAAHTVNYGSVSSCNICTGATWSHAGAATCSNCPTGYTYNTTSGKTDNTQCQISVPGGKYVGTVGAQGSTLGTCVAGTSKATHIVNYGSLSSCPVCGTNQYSDVGAAKCIACDSDYANSGTSASSHAGVTSCKVTCSPGTRVVNPNEPCTVPSDNTWYTPNEHVVSQTKVSPYETCPGGYTTRGTNATSHDQKTDCQINCAAGTQVASPDARCTTPNEENWYTDPHIVRATKTTEDEGFLFACLSANGYVNDGTVAANHATIRSCIVTCPDTTYVAESEGKCITIGTGYYRAEHTVRQTETSESEGTPRNLCPGRYTDGEPVAIEDDCISFCVSSDVDNSTSVSGEINYAWAKYGVDDERAIFTCQATSCLADYYLLAGNKGSPNGLASCPACVRYGTCAGGTDWFVCNHGYHYSDENYDVDTICDPDPYEIVLNKNGGFGMVNGVDDTANATQICYHGVVCDLPPRNSTEFLFDLTRGDSWGFTGWGYSPTCDTGFFQASVNAPGTLYACWMRHTVQCEIGEFYNAGKFEECPSGYYCTGDGSSPVDEIGCRTICPAGASGSDLGATDNKQCYYTCPDKLLTGGTTTKNEQRVYYDGAMYPKCTYNVTCDAGYVAYGSGTDAATCLKCADGQYCPGGNDPSAVEECPPGSYCPDGVIHECPNGGLSAQGAKYITDCYKTGLAYVATHGEGTQTCYYDDSLGTYSANCTNKIINICDAGYWLKTALVTNPDCDPVEVGYYSEGTGITREQCPASGLTDDRTSTKIQDCYQNGVRYIAQHGEGTQRCYYTSGAGTGAVYSSNCDTKKIDECDGGYWLVDVDDIECSAVDKNYYSNEGELERHACPADGLTGTTTAVTVSECYKEHLPYPDAEHGEAYYTCSHTSGLDVNAVYDTKCGAPTFTKCDGGYYFDVSARVNDCIKVGYGYYSVEDDLDRDPCPREGKTLTEVSASVTQCYREDMYCPIIWNGEQTGDGYQTCNYDEEDAEYTGFCQTCYVQECDETYAQYGDTMCIMCPENHVCHDKIQETCSAMTGGKYEFSDIGTMDVAMCYKTCDVDIAGHAAAMTGRDYYDYPDTCEIIRCQPGYTLQDGVCEPCPAGSYCDGTVTPILPGDDIKSCADLPGDGEWKYSDEGSDDPTDCYRMCEDYEIEYGTAIRINDTEQYPTACQYRGESITGNPCLIIDGRCVESACEYDYEMKNGICVPCNREHAMGYLPTGNCLVASCEKGYHPNGQQCESDIKACTVAGTHALYAEQTWDYALKAFGRCVIKECEPGYHLESNACITNTSACKVENGIGERKWDAENNKWGECIATSCNPGYTSNPDEMFEHNKQCGECKNKYSILGEIAASSYVKECEIASCMYQGELYALQDNECVPICPSEPYIDETGSVQRIGNKCVTTCQPGYIPW